MIEEEISYPQSERQKQHLTHYSLCIFLITAYLSLPIAYCDLRIVYNLHTIAYANPLSAQSWRGLPRSGISLGSIWDLIGIKLIGIVSVDKWISHSIRSRCDDMPVTAILQTPSSRYAAICNRYITNPDPKPFFYHPGLSTQAGAQQAAVMVLSRTE